MSLNESNWKEDEPMSKKKPPLGGQFKKNTTVSMVRSSAAEYLTFVAAGGESEASVEMRYEDENIWLTQKMMAALYDVSVPAINQHLKRIFGDNELDSETTIKQYLIVQTEGNRQVQRSVEHYNLQAISNHCRELLSPVTSAMMAGSMPLACRRRAIICRSLSAPRVSVGVAYGSVVSRIVAGSPSAPPSTASIRCAPRLRVLPENSTPTRVIGRPSSRYGS